MPDILFNGLSILQTERYFVYLLRKRCLSRSFDILTPTHDDSEGQLVPLWPTLRCCGNTAGGCPDTFGRLATSLNKAKQSRKIPV